ncbi:hypothetical protein IGI04_009509 [Brassica rapa subsp. trilocularis]|uniref:Uncharacterized protein n=1 Tax=Brassica rapa subsp. trilocularis TaxID=1813537 RepID=A0ABQ7N013_BRACM|nr:hypothetical protein IGI04_009509 [Brassica rapa subsp. trilocularis]
MEKMLAGRKGVKENFGSRRLRLTALNFSLNSNLLDGLIALVTGAGFWNSLSSVTSSSVQVQKA